MEIFLIVKIRTTDIIEGQDIKHEWGLPYNITKVKPYSPDWVEVVVTELQLYLSLIVKHKNW